MSEFSRNIKESKYGRKHSIVLLSSKSKSDERIEKNFTKCYGKTISLNIKNVIISF